MEEAERLMALFAGFDGAYGTHGEMTRNAEKSDKMEIKKSARTVREPVTLELWQAHVRGEHPIGIIPIDRSDQCRWGAIDVDRYDLDLGEVAADLKAKRLPLIPCRTKSGGVHLYLFLTEPVPAAHIQAKLKDLAALLGYGGSEVFPKQQAILWDSQDLGNWLNMPYFGGDQSERYAIGENGRGLTLRQFLTRAEEAARTPDEMAELRAPTEEDREFRDGPPCLQHLTGTGFPEGTRNNGLFALASFLKKKYPDKWDLMLEQVNQRFFSPPLPSAEVQGITKSQRGRDYKYKCGDMPLANHCNSGLCRTRKYGVGAGGTVPALESLAILDSDEPVYFLDVGGRRVELSTEELQTPIRFQRKCMEVIHVVVPILKKATWDAILQGLFENAVILDCPPEISLTGQFFEHLETFCTDRQRASERDELILGKAWHSAEDHRIYFRIKDIQEYLDRVKFRGFTRTQMSNRIKDQGGDTHFFNIKGRGVNVYWLPEELFIVQDEAHDLPESEERVV